MGYRPWRPFRRWFSPEEADRPTAGGPPGGAAADDPAAGPGAAPDPERAQTAAGDEDAQRGSQPVSANPAAVNIIAGTGALGRFLGLDEESGLRFGGLWVGDASGVLVGGRDPGHWGLNSLTILDFNLDAEKALGFKGGSFGTEFLQFTGQPTNGLAGAFPGFDSLEVTPPLTRQELYQLWYRQELFDGKLVFRIGKSVPTFDFNNVVRPVPVDDPAAAVPAVTGLLFTPVFVNPTMLGVIPGYYNSATGVTATFAPTKSVYMNYGFYDGNLANRQQTGLQGPRFNGYYFHIGEVGFAYRLGEQRKPGSFGVGVWGQTGMLDTFDHDAKGNPIRVAGANGVYLFGSQRLWFRRPGIDSSGVSGFYQFGANNSNALLARQYFGGGFTAFGLVPGRPDDSFGVGMAWTWLNRGDYAGSLFTADRDVPLQLSPSQLMFQAYYQMKLVDGVFAQTALTEIPTPGMNAQIPNALAISFRIIALF
jgi:porin